MTRFLIVRLGSLGDVIHGIPVVAALCERFSDARIDWLVDPQYVALLSLVRGLDKTVAVSTRGPMSAVMTSIGDMRRRHYHYAIDLQGLLKSAILARAAGAHRTIGFSRDHVRERAATLFYTERVVPHGAHVIDKNLSLLAPVGIERPSIEFPLNVPRTPAAIDASARFDDHDYVAINPGAAWPNKRWPPDRFGAVAAGIRSRLGLRSLVLWGPGEEALARAVVAASAGAAEISLPTSIIDLFAISRRARLMISGDTGPLHIATAVGTPVVALFGPTSAQRNGPWSPADVSISRMETCACVYERRCRRAVPCIDDISVAEVLHAVEQRVSAHG